MSFWLLAFSRSFGFLSVPPVPRLRQLGNRAFFTLLHCLPVATHTLSLSKSNIDLSLYIFPLPHKCRDLGTRTPRGVSAAVVMHFRFLRLKPDARCFVMSPCTFRSPRRRALFTAFVLRVPIYDHLSPASRASYGISCSVVCW